MIQRFENLELIKIHLMIENRKSLKIFHLSSINLFWQIDSKHLNN